MFAGLMVWHTRCLVPRADSSNHADFKPGEVWLDIAGQPINVHGGGTLFHNGTYYWYGENKEGRTWLSESNKAWDGYRGDVTGIRWYSSTDLSSPGWAISPKRTDSQGGGSSIDTAANNTN